MAKIAVVKSLPHDARREVEAQRRSAPVRNFADRLPATQEPAVPGAHKGDTALHQANGLIAQR